MHRGIVMLYYFGNHPHATRADGSKINTKAHYDYICREGRFSRMQDKAEELAFVCSGNMPDWADTAGSFWDTAEKNRRVHGRAYREIRMGLQEELSLEDNIAMVEEFLDKSGIGKNHAFTYAVHDKVAAFDKDHRNIHVHLMFCEKTIEKDRPLGPDMYFKQYAVDRDGMPCSGYKADRFYHDKRGTYAMRKMWADIVNAKFKERGLDISVTEKSLAAQRKEMLEQGKTEEAELLNRKPAPHLGDAYKNPKTLERIQETIKKIDEQTDDPAVTEEEKDEIDKQQSIQEQKLVIFATDALLRRTVNELRREYARYRRQRLQEEAAHAVEMEKEDMLQALEDSPVVITGADVFAEFERQVTSCQEKLNESKKAYDSIRKQVVPEKIIRSVAIERVVGSGYKNAMRQYDRIKKELEQLEKKDRELHKVPVAKKADFLQQYSDAITRKNLLSKRIADYTKAINGSEKKRIEKTVQEIKENNAKCMAASKKMYRDMQILSHKKEQLETKKTALIKQLPMDKILYAEKLHDVVLRSTKIKGYLPVKEYPMAAYSGRAYALLDMPDGAAKCTDAMTVSAVMLGDKTVKGKAPVYTVTIQYEQGKLKIKSIEKTDTKIRMYALINNRNNAVKSQVGQLQQNKFLGKLDRIMSKALEENAGGKYNALWQSDDEEKHKDKVQQTEQEMYQGWSM